MKLRHFVQTALTWAVRLTPKFNWCVLRGFPDFEDSCIAIYEGLAAYPGGRTIWVVGDPEARAPFHIRTGTILVRRGSLRDYMYSIFAKYLFITHGHFVTRIPKNQICINLWHGIPYKVIGRLDGKEGRSDTHFVATSSKTKEIFAEVFGVGPERMIVTGQARTDRLFVPDVASTKARLGLGIDAQTKLFLWLPTYRQTAMGQARIDGRASDNVFNCDAFPAEAFDAYLRQNNAVCIIKPHPMAPVPTCASLNNLVTISDNWLHARGLTLYQLAGVSDCLISDISSIVIDFLLLDRPLVLLFEDIDEYTASRGFVFDPIEDWLPARVNRDFAAFSDDIAAVIDGHDRYRSVRTRLKKIFFAYEDDHSTARILKHVLHLDSGACANG